MLGHRSLDMVARLCREDRQPHRRRRVLRGHRQERSPLRPGTRAARRRDRARAWPGRAASTTACSATATAPAYPELDRCAFGSICETCTFFQTRHRLPAPHPASPARRRHRQAPSPPRAAVRLRCSPGPARAPHEPPAPAPGPPPASPPTPVTGGDSLQVLTDAIEHLARLRTAYWPGDSAVHLHALASPHRPGPAAPAPRPSTTPATMDSTLDPDRPAPGYHRRHSGPPLPQQAMINLIRSTGIMPN